jgi:opacity protein-like surface antigen
MSSHPPVIEAKPVTIPTALPMVYLGMKVGANLMTETKFTTSAIAGNPAITTTYDPGYTANVAVGYDLGQAFGMFGGRAEVEIGMLRTDVKSHATPVATFSGPNALGHADSLYGLVNAYVDAHVGVFKPYLGVGLGLAHTRLRNHGVNAPGTVIALDDGGFSFAWQASAGVGLQIEEGVTLDVGYRYLRMEQVGLRAGTIGNDVSVGNHQISVGLRYGF